MSTHTEAFLRERMQSLRLLEAKTSESRPLTPPCRRVLGEPTPEGLLVLPPDVDSVHFNSAVRLTSQTCKRRRSADRVERKLNTVESVERSHSAGGRLTEGKCHGCSPSLKKENINNQVQNSSKCGKLNEVTAQSFLDRISEMNITSEVSGTVSGDSSSLENSDPELPIELTAEFISSVMKEEYQKALGLCEEILSIDSSNHTYLEFQDLIKEKLHPDEQSEKDEEDDDDEDGDSEISTETDDDETDDDDKSSEDSSHDEDESETEESEGDEESSENSSESDTELPSGHINLLMGGLPLRTVSISNDDTGQITLPCNSRIP